MQMYKMSLLLAVALVAGTAQAGTEEEIRDVVKANISHTNKTMSQDPTRISKDGSKEFFSSGGLLNTGRHSKSCLLYTSPSPRDHHPSRMPAAA